MASAGLARMLVSMVASVLLITDFLLPTSVAVVLSVATGVWFLFFWAALPFARRNWGDAEEDEDDEDTEDENEKGLSRRD